VSFAASYFQRFYHGSGGIISEFPDPATSLIVTIPAFREEGLLYTLESIRRCEVPPAVTEVLVLINYPAQDASEDFHRHQYNQIRDWAAKNSSPALRFFPLLMALPRADAGVGLARKILMDEAVYRFSIINKPEGLIVGLDADCRCEKNYLNELFSLYHQHPQINTCSIYFEHPLSGNEYSVREYEAIAVYELYLRYYIEGLRMAAYPFAFNTIGSAFAVRAAAYVKQGGMNRRKAGEDFYFLNKMMLLGGYGELNTTVVYPAPRLSDRVPFGTGSAVRKITDGSHDYLYTWNPQVFNILRDFTDSLPACFAENKIPELHPLLSDFLEKNQWSTVLDQAKRNANHGHTFVKRIFQWFDGLKVLQFIRYAHQNGLPRIHLLEAGSQLLFTSSMSVGCKDIVSLLLYYRNVQRQNNHSLFW
jgi:hypothetical protein